MRERSARAYVLLCLYFNSFSRSPRTPARSFSRLSAPYDLAKASSSAGKTLLLHLDHFDLVNAFPAREVLGHEVGREIHR